MAICALKRLCIVEIIIIGSSFGQVIFHFQIRMYRNLMFIKFRVTMHNWEYNCRDAGSGACLSADHRSAPSPG